MLGISCHLPVVTPIICPGGSYKKIGYYHGNIAWNTHLPNIQPQRT